MANKHTTLTDLFTATANAIREKTGRTEPIKADDFPEAISAIQIGKTSYTINLDWSMDMAGTCGVWYISNGVEVYCESWSAEVIEADGGVVKFSIGNGSYYSEDSFIELGVEAWNYYVVATKDGGTITLVSDGGQDF